MQICLFVGGKSQEVLQGEGRPGVRGGQMILFSIKIALRSPLSLALAPLLGPQWAAKAAAGRKILAANPLRIGATVPNFDLEATMGAFRWSGALQAPSKQDSR